MAVRSRTRNVQKSGNPFIMLGVAAALVGLGLISLAGWYYVSQREKRARRVKVLRGVDLLEKLTPIACDYFYTGKHLALKREPVPTSVWAPFVAAHNDGDLVDAVITDHNPQPIFYDAAFYRTGKSADGQSMVWGMAATGSEYLGEAGPAPEPHRTQVQVVEGFVQIGGVRRKAMFFRRPILVDLSKTDREYGKAVIILLADVPSPEPGAASGSATPPAGAGAANDKTGEKPGDKPGDKGGAEPDDKAGAKPDQKPATETGAKQ